MTNTEDAGFAGLGLPEHLLRALEKLGYQQPTPIQQAAIPPLLKGGDVLGMAQTGTGKTAAFALPILAEFTAENTSGKRQQKPKALVLAPTRELAQQVAEAFSSYDASGRNCRVLSVYGGAPYTTQIRALKQGVDVVVGTPGRVMDHMRKGTLDVSALSTLVLDEADEMLRMGFIDDVEWVLGHTPDDRQIALFSATMPNEISRIAKKYLNRPAEIRVDTATSSAKTIRQRYIVIRSNQKMPLLARLLEVEDTDAAMVFVRTKLATTEVADYLRSQGHAAEALSGDLSQELREKTVQRLKNGKIDVVVATDVAARGLDVDRISHVINYDIPYDPEAYVHRIGRTGRAGRSGDAILFVQPREQRMLRQIERVTKSDVTAMDIPSVEDVNNKRQADLSKRLQNRAKGNLSTYQALAEKLQAETGLEYAELAAALAAELNGGKSFLLDARDQLQAQPADKRGAKGNESRGNETRGKNRRERPDRNNRDHRPVGRRRAGNTGAEGQAGDLDKERFRIAVGHSHGVKPGNIVGAIANEVGLDSNNIGRIEINDDHSFVDLPEGMPKDLFNHLKGVYVCGQKLAISRPGDNSEAASKPAATSQTPAKRRRPESPEASANDGNKPPAKRKPRSKTADKGAPKKKKRKAVAERKKSSTPKRKK